MKKIVYLVHCVDTEGPLYESLEATFDRIKAIFGVDLEPSERNLKLIQARSIDLGGKEQAIANLVSDKRIKTNGAWGDIDSMLRRLDDVEFRRSINDDAGTGWVFSWFCLDHVGFTGRNPRRRDAGDHKVFDFYTEWLKKSGTQDIVQWHYHPLPYTGDFNGSGTAYLNSNNIWEILAKKIVDRHWFPSAYRPGFHTERPDSHWFLEQWIPFDYGNQAVIGVDTDQPDLANGRYGDWRRAPNDWSIYHPSHDDYQVPGNCRRWIARCLNIEARLRVLTDSDLVAAFTRANTGIPTLVSVTNHDFRDMHAETASLIERINVIKSIFPDVELLCVNALEGIRLALDLPKSSPGLTCELIRESDSKYIVQVGASGTLFGTQPFLAVQTRTGMYLWENFDQIDAKRWSFTFDENHIPSNVLKTIGVAANSPYGTGEIFSIDVDHGKWKRTTIN